MKLLLAIFLTLSLTSHFSQIHHCSTDEMHQKLYADHPEIHTKVIQNATWLENFTQLYQMSKSQKSILYTIPVVFHVIHLNGPENISDAQILDQMRIINEDYQKRNADTVNTIAAFKGIAADCQLEFKLAQIDPDGNCTSGITRHYDARTIGGYHDVKEIVHWDPTMYLNIYVCKGAAGLAGHAIVPAAADTIPEWDGIVIAHSSVGDIGTGAPSRSVVLTHEIGHYMNLQHIWGGNNVPGYPYLVVNEPGNCAFDDGVADTPETIGWSTCNLNHTSCGSLDNVQNFMEYAYCPTMFTEGQKQRIHATLNSPIAGRNNLWSATNLSATGVNNVPTFCKTHFIQDKIQICTGESIQFTDLSYNDVNTWNWTFTGGNPATSSIQNPSVVYNTPGVYEVKLVSGDGINADSLAISALITVLPNTGVANSIIEGFEAVSDVNSTQFLPVPSGGNSTWSISNQAGYNSGNSILLDNFNGNIGEVSQIISEPLDLSNVNALTLSFDYAFAKKKSATPADKLTIKVSDDCGENWSVRKQIAGSALLTVLDSVPNSFIPSNDYEWKNVVITNIISSFWTVNFRVKFEFEGAGGNNLYLDNINLFDPAMAGVNLLEQETLRIFPNPTHDIIQISDIKVKWKNYQILNNLGQMVSSGTINDKGTFTISNLENGIYWVNLQDESGKMIVRKIVKN